MLELNERNKNVKTTENSLGDFFHSKNLLKDDEQLDDLERDGLMLIQKKQGYHFTTDAVLLSGFASAKTNDTYVDLCSGSGVVAILMNAKNKIKQTFMVELQRELSNMAERSVLYNGLKNITAVCSDLKNAHNVLGYESVDVITVNPPYYENGLASEIHEISTCTHELSVSLEDIVFEVSKLLKFGGKLFMVHLAERLTDILFLMRKHKLEPKRMRVVYPKASKAPNLVLIEAKKGAKSGIKIESPLILMNEDNTESEELKEIYGRK